MRSPLYFDFFGKLSVTISSGSILYAPALAVIGQTFACFKTKVRPEKVTSLDIQLGSFTPDLRHRHLVDGRYFISDESLYCEYQHKFATWKMDVKGLESERTELTLSGNLASAWVFPHETIYQFILYKLGKAGFAFLHALGVSKDGRADVIIGRSGVGKSTLGGKFLQAGYKLLGDDTVLVDAEGWAYGFPLPLGFRSMNGIFQEYGLVLTFGDRVFSLARLALKAATLGYIHLLCKVAATRLGTDRLEAKVRLGRSIFVLPEVGFSWAKVKDSDTFLNQVMVCGCFEMTLLAKLLEAYDYVFPESDLSGFFTDQRKILQQAFSTGHSFHAGIPPQMSDHVYTDLQEAMQGG